MATAKKITGDDLADEQAGLLVLDAYQRFAQLHALFLCSCMDAGQPLTEKQEILLTSTAHQAVDGMETEFRDLLLMHAAVIRPGNARRGDGWRPHDPEVGS